HIDLGRGVLGESTLHQMRNPACELDDLLTAAYLPERVGKHLAVLGGDDRRQLLLARIQQLPEGEEDLGALGQGGVPPPRERGRSRSDHLVDVVFRSQCELCGHLAGGRVGHVGEPSAVAFEDLPGLPVVERRCHGFSYLMMLDYWMIMITW